MQSTLIERSHNYLTAQLLPCFYHPVYKLSKDERIQDRFRLELMPEVRQ